MSKDAPDEMDFVVVNDLFLHYDVMYDDREEKVQVECERCDETAALLSYDVVSSLDEMDLYERIIDAHEIE